MHIEFTEPGGHRPVKLRSISTAGTTGKLRWPLRGLTLRWPLRPTVKV